MKNIQAILAEGVATQGWNENSQLSLVTDYLQRLANDNDSIRTDFEDFVNEAIDLEFTDELLADDGEENEEQ